MMTAQTNYCFSRDHHHVQVTPRRSVGITRFQRIILHKIQQFSPWVFSGAHTQRHETDNRSNHSN